MTEAKPLATDYLLLSPKGVAEPWTAEAFWQMAMNPDHEAQKPDMGYLVSEFTFDKDWEAWEIHPEGHEIVYCISGAMTFLLDYGDSKTELQLNPGDRVVVPKNTWHTANISQPTKALFVTWGYGTQNKSRQ